MIVNVHKLTLGLDIITNITILSKVNNLYNFILSSIGVPLSLKYIYRHNSTVYCTVIKIMI